LVDFQLDRIWPHPDASLTEVAKRMSGFPTAETLTAELTRRGAIAPAATPFAFQSSERPWFISALLGVAGWLAGIFVLVFIAALFEPRGYTSYIVFAAVLLPAAFGLYAADRHNAFFDQLALALSIAGQISATAAIADITKSAASTAGAVAVMQCLLVFVMPNRIARSIAAFFACIAWALAIRFAWWGEGGWRGSRAPVALGSAIVGWFVIWIPVAALVTAIIASEAKWMARKDARLVRPALGGLLLALTFGTLVSVPLDAFDSLWVANGRPHTNWLALWPLFDIMAALLAGLGAFRLRSMPLLGVAIAAALLHMMQFYYLLGTTLVIKSVIMLLVGGLLLGSGILLKRSEPTA
jgi:hypothetical protein